MKKLFIPLLLAAMLCSCKEEQNENQEEMARKQAEKEVITVTSTKLEKTTFYHELVSNGKVYAIQQATVPFRVQGIIRSLHIRNGQKVSAGDLLATLEDFNYKLALDRAQLSLEKAGIEFQDDLIRGNHSIADTSELPEAVIRMARLRSGYEDALNNLKEAEYNYNNTRITAPISGVVSGLEAKENNLSSQYENLCCLIDYSAVEVEFPVMESEYLKVRTGMPITVFPMNAEEKEYKGSITAINPVVGDHGMIQVRARVQNAGNELLQGMNVRIRIRKPLPDQLIIPKEARVMRQGREVVFVRVDSVAIWKYVTTGFENSTSYTITEGLEEGDHVIYRGNLNLAHESIVAEEK